VRVIAADYDNQRDEFSLDAPIVSHDTQQWSNYVRGVVKHLQKRNNHFGGADLVISGNDTVPTATSSEAEELKPAPCGTLPLMTRSAPPKWLLRFCRTARKSPLTARKRKTSSSAVIAALWTSLFRRWVKKIMRC
jgi:hypothetical protein